jgi:hypothetical protein
MRPEYELDNSKAKRGRHYKRLVKKGSNVFVVIARGRVIARVPLDSHRQVQARKWLHSLRKTATVGDVVGPSGEAWDAEDGRSFTRTSTPKRAGRRKAK